ncbi:alpha-glucan family phosphorylase [Paenibacillus chartarius]|uniref:Alpha-glucan family phosphorylase n=1 Tax=Paenibacillus chartarius TaxID=747481 RepID=A0ABV6DHW6_9BACL
MTHKVAYFCAEFGIDEALPIYSGGLGVLAGDHIKAANDLDLPLIGVGIFYSRGYFQQRIREDGVQEHMHPALDTSKLPIELVTGLDGLPLIIEVPIAGRRVCLKAWRTDVGKIPVYLLNSDVEPNSEYDRRLTDTLYASDPDIRISQEMILGIGGVRLLNALGIVPDVWHMNEGHSAFLTLERIRGYSAEGVPFDTALEAVRACTIFTTHTPVPAGHDTFPIAMMDRFFGDYYWQLGADREKILALGRIGDRFNMTRLAVSASSKVNGVSKLHAEVTKGLFHQWMPHIPQADIAVDAVTNGIHIGTWLSSGMKELFDRHLRSDWDTNTSEPGTWAPVRDIPEEQVWNTHLQAKESMLQELGLPSNLKNMLTIGFARRFATYKRALLAFQDLDRLDKIVNDPHQPVCFVFSGKAHPADGPGQSLIRSIVEIAKQERFRNRIFVVENYDIGRAKKLVQGVDVWLNTPEKPMEASGTSGQKAAVNGVINLSVRDGWWDEGYNGRNGWAIDGAQSGDSEERFRSDSSTLYRLLEKEIVPLFYRRDDRAVPAGWVGRMKESICSLAPVYNTHRMVSEYWNRLYVPIMERGQRFTAAGLEIAGKVAAYKAFIRNHWQQVTVQDLQMSSFQATKIGLTKTLIQAKVHLGPIWVKDVCVEAVGSDGKGGIRKVELAKKKELDKGLYVYEGELLESIDALWKSTANVRVTPISRDFSHDFEMELAAWG